LFDARHIKFLQDRATVLWHDSTSPALTTGEAFDQLVLAQHRSNFDLWHREDEARDPLATDQAITAIKRAIDKLNQLRNDLVENVDLMLLDAAPSQLDTLPLHSETPGLMIDRLSILALKRFHTKEETQRKEVEEDHRRRNRDRLATLNEQSEDLVNCLETLWADVLDGKRRFKLYRQFKMYNDPSLNPVLYSKGSVASP
jgi:hypothetical protein